jgi:hypothetical protein
LEEIQASKLKKQEKLRVANVNREHFLKQREQELKKQEKKFNERLRKLSEEREELKKK